MESVVMTAVANARDDDRTIAIASDFSPSPGGRYRKHGPWSGEEFRDDYLLPALQESRHVTVYLDGTAGYAGSFLEEAFGGLIRERGFTLPELRQRLAIVTRNPKYAVFRLMAEDALEDAAAKLKKRA
jgi:hypothetical protein